MNININTIQKEIDQLFNKYKIPAITKNLPMENLQEWARKVAKHFKLNEENFRQNVTELFWNIGHVQLSLGHMLIALQECKLVDGEQGVAFQEKDIPNIEMAEIYFWYYSYNTHECIYIEERKSNRNTVTVGDISSITSAYVNRCWERINNVLMHACFPCLSEEQFKKQYFPQTINALQQNSKYSQNPYLKELQDHKKYRKEASDDRNEISHGESSPMRNMIIEGKVSNILGTDGLPFIYLDYSSKSLNEELNRIIDKYKKVLPAIKTMKNFIDNVK